MIESFIKSNYQLLFWLMVLVIVFAAVFWFFKCASSKRKSGKEAKETLQSTRKEIIFELVKGKGENGFNEKEIADFLNIKEKEAHKHLIELVRERRIIMDSDLGQVARYVYKKNERT